MPMAKSPNMSLRKSDRHGIVMDVDQKELREFIWRVNDKLIYLKFDEKINKEKELSHGGHGKVVDVKYRGATYAFKRPKEDLDRWEFSYQGREFLREVLTAIHMDGHPACTPTSFWGVTWDNYDCIEKTFGIVMRKMVGSLCAHERGENPPLRELGATGRTCVAYGMAVTMGDLHRLGIMHRDFKPQNVLIDEKGDPYLCDFGGVKVARGGVTSLNSTQGTRIFAHPSWRKCLQGEGSRHAYYRGYDVYAYGLFYMYLCIGSVGGGYPEKYDGEQWRGLINRISKFYDHLNKYNINQRREFEKICNDFIPNEDQRNYVKTLCADDPEASLTFDQVAEDIRTKREYWFKGTDENKFNQYVESLDAARKAFLEKPPFVSFELIEDICRYRYLEEKEIEVVVNHADRGDLSAMACASALLYGGKYLEESNDATAIERKVSAVRMAIDFEKRLPSDAQIFFSRLLNPVTNIEKAIYYEALGNPAKASEFYKEAALEGNVEAIARWSDLLGGNDELRKCLADAFRIQEEQHKQ